MLIRRCGNGLLVHAPAKLNLFLELTGKRSDGFHELETLMVSVDLYDALKFEEAPSGSVQLHVSSSHRLSTGAVPSTHELPPVGKDNLVFRAAELLREYSGVTSGVRIRLFKRIPIGAGMAGGSSDAAATLVALNRLWDTRLSVGELMALAARIGSDVSFFMPSVRAAVCSGRGERVQPMQHHCPLHFVVVRPATGLATVDVFRRCRVPDRPLSVEPVRRALRTGRLAELASGLHNRLQSPAFELNSELNSLKTALQGYQPLHTLMTGSGSAMFGLCPTRRHALRTAAGLRMRGFENTFVVDSRI